MLLNSNGSARENEIPIYKLRNPRTHFQEVPKAGTALMQWMVRNYRSVGEDRAADHSMTDGRGVSVCHRCGYVWITGKVSAIGYALLLAAVIVSPSIGGRSGDTYYTGCPLAYYCPIPAGLMIAAEIKPMLAEQAKQRQLATLKQNQKNDNTVVQNLGEREEQPERIEQ